MKIQFSTKRYFYLLAIVFISSFTLQAQKVKQDTEAREDSIELAGALALQSKFTFRIQADSETEPVVSESGADAADDPAIWVNPKNPAKSLILGTNKKAGVYVYDLKGKTRQFIASGRINNIDLRDGFVYNGRTVALVAGSNRSNNSVSLYVIDHRTCQLSDTLLNIRSGVDEVYGICMYHQPAGNRFYVIVNGKGGKIEQWEISNKNNSLTASLINNFAVATQPEGMVVDDKTGTLYLGVEHEGIFSTNLNVLPLKLELIPLSTEGNSNIKFDIEGLAFYQFDNQLFLIASIQGNFSYAIFNLSDGNQYVKSFVVENGAIDGSEETDGIDITHLSCGKKYPHGILVVQDGFNTNGKINETQNFKIVSASKLLPLLIKR